MQLFYTTEIVQDELFLRDEELHHASKVLRLKERDTIHATDGMGNLYTANILSITKKELVANISAKEFQAAEEYAHIAVAPTKNADRIEWFVEKAVEIGIKSIFLIDCKHGEKKKINEERLQKKVLSAMKQSMGVWLPQIQSLQPFGSFIKEISNQEMGKFIAYVDFDNPVHLKDKLEKGKDSLVLIGPEGDFSREELDLAFAAGFQKISLGRKRLRTETAALAACHIIHLANE